MVGHPAGCLRESLGGVTGEPHIRIGGNILASLRSCHWRGWQVGGCGPEAARSEQELSRATLKRRPASCGWGA